MHDELSSHPDHSWLPCKSLCRPQTAELLWQACAMTLRYYKKRQGPSTEPCGTSASYQSPYRSPLNIKTAEVRQHAWIEVSCCGPAAHNHSSHSPVHLFALSVLKSIRVRCVGTLWTHIYSVPSVGKWIRLKTSLHQNSQVSEKSAN